MIIMKITYQYHIQICEQIKYVFSAYQNVQILKCMKVKIDKQIYVTTKDIFSQVWKLLYSVVEFAIGCPFREQHLYH